MGGKAITYGFLALVFIGACGVGSINQTTAGGSQATTGSTGNTTGAVQPSGTTSGSTVVGATTAGDTNTGTGGNGSTPAGTTATGGTTGTAATAGTTTAAATAGDTTAGATTAGTATAGTAPTTTAGTTPVIQDPNRPGTPSADPNAAKLFDMGSLTNACCYYNSNTAAFSLAMNTDTQYCTHVALAGRVASAHEMSITATVTANSNAPAGAQANNGNSLTATNASATLSLYDTACILKAQASAASGSLQLSQANDNGCAGTFSFTMQQTTPTAGAAPTVVNGSFSAARCLALGAALPTSRCVAAGSP